ncbi:VOC family protein [Allokutzneria oryzae]|uniref:VOC family protein n=1 Tax=Allokutzneria oryzae TaxID=1378989 RepID=A0ABV5ZW40_9PSEU
MEHMTPYLSTKEAAKAIEFYGRAFGATTKHEPVVMPDGRVGHAELAIGTATFMLADEFPEIDYVSPVSQGGGSVQLMLTVDDPDAVFERAVQAGAHPVEPVTLKDYGARMGRLTDPFGHSWQITSAF